MYKSISKYNYFKYDFFLPLLKLFHQNYNKKLYSTLKTIASSYHINHAYIIYHIYYIYVLHGKTWLRNIISNDHNYIIWTKNHRSSRMGLA